MAKFQGYRCFSINQLRFIKLHDIKPISKGVHDNGKTYWIFELNDELSRVLTAWTNSKPKNN